MSTRAIASAVGVDRNTVMTDLQQVAEFQPPAAPPARKEPMSTPTAETASHAGGLALGALATLETLSYT